MKKTAYLSPSPDLLQRIITRIHKEERVLVLKKLIIFSLTLVGSIVAFVPATGMLVSQLQSSEFMSFASLIFSDSGAVLTYWRSFLMVILQTLPAISIAFFLAVLLTFLQSVKSVARNVKLILN
jgi:hypothetical protein